MVGCPGGFGGFADWPEEGLGTKLLANGLRVNSLALGFKVDFEATLLSSSAAPLPAFPSSSLPFVFWPVSNSCTFVSALAASAGLGSYAGDSLASTGHEFHHQADNDEK
jgi:hypothetical protein